MKTNAAQRVFFMLLALVCLALAAGCADEKNLLSNARFEKWAGGPEKWSTEGDGVIKRAKDGAELTTTVSSSGFLYQRISAKRRYRGGTVTLAALVKSDTPDSTVIEFSDRRGTDIKGEAHPGDGQWRLMQLTVKVPEASENLEFRLRNYKGGTATVKEASMSGGAAPMIEDRASMVSVERGSGSRAFAIASLAGLLGVTAVYFRRHRKRRDALALEASLFLFIVANMMLVAQKPAYAAATSTAACAVFVLWAFWHAGKKKVLSVKLRSVSGLAARPGALFVILAAAALFFCIYALAARDILLANKAAGYAFWLMIAGAALTGAEAFIKKLRNIGSASGVSSEISGKGLGEPTAVKGPNTHGTV